MLRPFVYFLAPLSVAAAIVTEAPSEKPSNIILINLDDADTDLFTSDSLQERFPNIKRLADEGVRFTNLHVTTPVCGPSRACLFRGQYAHNTGFKVHGPSHSSSQGYAGGWDVFKKYINDELGVWMKNGGYRTMLVGKYMHEGYHPMEGDPNPPGWDEFACTKGGLYFGHTRFVNGKRFSHKSSSSAYRTDEESSDNDRFLSTHAKKNSGNDGKPFFLYSAPFAPHMQTGVSDRHPEVGRAAPRYLSWWKNVSLPLTPDTNEVNMSDKHPMMQQLPLLGLKQLRKEYRARLLSVRSVDDMLGSLFDKLKKHQWDDKTFILFTSDNGFSLGQHRLKAKRDPFQRSTNVPLFVWGPGVPAVSESAGHLLAHIDLTATILDLAGIEPPSFLDGVSFKSLIKDPLSVAENEWRSEVLIQNFDTKRISGITLQTSYASLRRFDSVYTEWSNGYREYYNLSAAADPHQMENSYHRLTNAEKSALVAQIRSTKDFSPPESTISSPFYTEKGFQPPMHLAGVAEDGAGVSEVRLVIFERSTGTRRYWNGKSFVEKWTQIRADLAAPAGQISNWSYTFDPPPSMADGTYWFSARAFSISGTYQEPPVARTFILESSPPTTTISSPSSSGKTFATPMQLAGVAEDGDGVAEVRLIIFEMGTAPRRYWAGSSFVPWWTQIQADLAKPAGRISEWSYIFDPPQSMADGNYWFSARVFSTSGIYQEPPVWGTFTIDNMQ